MGVALQRLFSLVVAIGLIGSVAMAQTKEEAVAAYNEAAGLLKAEKKVEALKAFQNCVEISEKLGAEGTETLQMAGGQIPKLQYDLAMTALKTKKFEEAIKGFEETIAAAKKFDDAQIASVAEGRIPLTYYYKGNELRKQKQVEAAVAAYDKTLEMDPTYIKAALAKALAYRSAGDEDGMFAAIDQTLSIGSKGKDQRSLMTAEKLATTTTYNNAVKALQAKNYAEVIKQLEKTIAYGNENATIYFQMGLSYNNMNQWDKAIEALNKGVELENGGNEDKARLFYEMGTAYAGKGDNAKACDAFKNAMYGDYAANAKYQVEQVLKCDGSN